MVKIRPGEGINRADKPLGPLKGPDYKVTRQGKQIRASGEKSQNVRAAFMSGRAGKFQMPYPHW